jgi:hypothetical protein
MDDHSSQEILRRLEAMEQCNARRKEKHKNKENEVLS